MIKKYSFIEQNVQLQEILNSFREIDFLSFFGLRAILVSLPCGVDSSVVASLLHDTIDPLFFDGKAPVINYKLNPRLENDLIFFSDVLYEAQRFCFPFRGIYHIELSSDIQHHLKFLTEVVQILQQYEGKVIPVFTIFDCDDQDLARIKQAMEIFMPVFFVRIPLSYEARKAIIKDVFNMQIDIDDDAVDCFAKLTDNKSLPYFMGICDCLKTAAKQSTGKITSTYIKAFAETHPAFSSHQIPSIPTIGFR